jgi:CRISPR-associated protein Csx14
MPEYTHTMLATLGGQPQVVTFTLDLLLQRQIPISEVIIIHPEASQPRLKHSIECLNAEFAGDRYRYANRIIRFRSHVLRLGEQSLDDIVDDTSANGALDTIHGLIRDLKQQHKCIHLSVSGGRRLMSLLAISAALLNFDHADHIWHIYTPETIRQQANEGAMMHTSSISGVNLIEMPFAPWGKYFPGLAQLIGNSAKDLLQSQVAEMDALERERCDKVAKNPDTTRRELEALQAFARGLTPQEVADALTISIKTVDTYKTHLLDRCRGAWDIQNQKLNYRFLHQKFAPYFHSNEYTHI